MMRMAIPLALRYPADAEFSPRELRNCPPAATGSFWHDSGRQESLLSVSAQALSDRKGKACPRGWDTRRGSQALAGRESPEGRSCGVQ